MADEKKLMTLDETADYLRCSRRTMYEWLRIGKINGVKIGRRWLFDRDEVRKVPR